LGDVSIVVTPKNYAVPIYDGDDNIIGHDWEIDSGFGGGYEAISNYRIINDHDNSLDEIYYPGGVDFPNWVARETTKNDNTCFVAWGERGWPGNMNEKLWTSFHPGEEPFPSWQEMFEVFGGNLDIDGSDLVGYLCGWASIEHRKAIELWDGLNGEWKSTIFSELTTYYENGEKQCTCPALMDPSYDWENITIMSPFEGHLAGTYTSEQLGCDESKYPIAETIGFCGGGFIDEGMGLNRGLFSCKECQYGFDNAIQGVGNSRVSFQFGGTGRNLKRVSIQEIIHS
jgi:hypothetical protein